MVVGVYVIEQLTDAPLPPLSVHVVCGEKPPPELGLTLFDFDCCGMGWRAVDLAVYRWNFLGHRAVKNAGGHFSMAIDACAKFPNWICAPYRC